MEIYVSCLPNARRSHQDEGRPLERRQDTKDKKRGDIRRQRRSDTARAKQHGRDLVDLYRGK